MRANHRLSAWTVAQRTSGGAIDLRSSQRETVQGVGVFGVVESVMALCVLELDDVGQPRLVTLLGKLELNAGGCHRPLGAANTLQGRLPVQKRGLDLEDHALAQVLDRVLERFLFKARLLHL